MTSFRSRLGIRPSWTSTLARPRSPSNSSTRLPAFASACDSVTENQVLPTPPLPEATAIRFFPRLKAGAGASSEGSRLERNSSMVLSCLGGFLGGGCSLAAGGIRHQQMREAFGRELYQSVRHLGIV